MEMIRNKRKENYEVSTLDTFDLQDSNYQFNIRCSFDLYYF